MTPKLGDVVIAEDEKGPFQAVFLGWRPDGLAEVADKRAVCKARVAGEPKAVERSGRLLDFAERLERVERFLEQWGFAP